MKFIVKIIFIFFFYSASAQKSLTICSWNLKDFGKSKNDTELEYIANTINKYDIIAIQEVVAGDGGAQTVARLSDILNRKGSKWDYTISDPTSSSAYKTERYAYIWKTSRVTKNGNAWLEKKYHLEIDREPYYATFKYNGKVFTLVNFHAITKSKQPEREIKYFKFLPLEYPDKNLIFCGDFNAPESHSVFNPLKSMGFKPIFTGQKTSLRQKIINNDGLASEYDNIFYRTSKITFVSSGVVHFYKSFLTLKEAKCISDHIPIYFQFELI
ncbi:endonuclease [Solitalea longa]|uniref:Endonuclease n=1 Tax=Solitalea longa TaxID=2079460 RepID=A0A2S5A2F7_9SPHI|nr:endonuclease/exonuclease/phosphatase family protein [Solitalea longa]POY36778.1 endonuclease [Solitalea longa]